MIPLETTSLVAGGTSGGGGARLPTPSARRASARVRDFDTIVIDGGSRPTRSAVSELADPTLLLVTSADRLAPAATTRW